MPKRDLNVEVGIKSLFTKIVFQIGAVIIIDGKIQYPTVVAQRTIRFNLNEKQLKEFTQDLIKLTNKYHGDQTNHENDSKSMV